MDTLLGLRLESDATRRRLPLRVGVLVALPHGRHAGGHVKCWERLARAATSFSRTLDLTVHFMGDEGRVEELAPNVRYVIEKPVFSTARLPFLSHVPDHTDLAPWHPRLARMLCRYDLIHTTEAFFAYSRTAERMAHRLGLPIVNSVHTNTPGYARIFTALTIERLFGKGRLSGLLTDRLRLHRRVEQRMRRQLAEHQRKSAFAFVSRPDQLEAAQRLTGRRAGLLRRGIDHAFFHPGKRDRAWLERAFGIPEERPVVLFAGRLNRGKNVVLLAEAATAALRRGLDLHLVCAGEGDQRSEIVERLGNRALCPGAVDPEVLARLYASADLFAFPSRIEECANVVLEATASGLPTLLAAESGMGRAILDNETGLVLPGDCVPSWTEAIAALAADAPRRRRMARAARRYAERHLPSWEEVLVEDLLPRWLEAARCPLPLS